jgi:hypothetical protein
MRWRTFERLVEAHDRHADWSMCAMMAKLGIAKPGGSG